MKKLGLLIAMVGAALLLTTNVMAQETAGEEISYSVEAMCVLDINDQNVVLAFEAPETGGTEIADATGSGGSANYTSVIANGATNKITAEIGAGEVTALEALGTTLTLQAGAIQGGGAGNKGNTNATGVVLSATGQDIITGIGSCWTDVGADKGCVLNYTWSITDYTKIEVEATATVNLLLTVVNVP